MIKAKEDKARQNQAISAGEGKETSGTQEKQSCQETSWQDTSPKICRRHPEQENSCVGRVWKEFELHGGSIFHAESVRLYSMKRPRTTIKAVSNCPGGQACFSKSKPPFCWFVESFSVKEPFDACTQTPRIATCLSSSSCMLLASDGVCPNFATTEFKSLNVAASRSNESNSWIPNPCREQECSPYKELELRRPPKRSQSIEDHMDIVTQRKSAIHEQALLMFTSDK